MTVSIDSPGSSSWRASGSFAGVSEAWLMLVSRCGGLWRAMMGRQIGVWKRGHFEIWPCYPPLQTVAQDGFSNSLDNPCSAR